MTSQQQPSIAINVEMRTAHLTTQSYAVTRVSSSNGPISAVHGSTRRDICPSSPPSHEVPELEFSGAAELSHQRYTRCPHDTLEWLLPWWSRSGVHQKGFLTTTNKPTAAHRGSPVPTSFGIAPRPASGYDLQWSSPNCTQDGLGRLTWKLPLSALVCLPRFRAHRSRLAA